MMTKKALLVYVLWPVLAAQAFNVPSLDFQSSTSASMVSSAVEAAPSVPDHPECSEVHLDEKGIASPEAPNCPSSPVDLEQVCTLLIDGSGSGADQIENRKWLLNRVGIVSAIYRSPDHDFGLVIAVYDEQVRTLRITWDNPELDVAQIRVYVDESLQSNRWTDPLPAFRQMAVDSSACIVHVTDGSLDFPPGPAQDPAAHIVRILAAVNALEDRGIAVLTIALADDNDHLWREVAERTGGTYLVDPDDITVRKEIMDMLSRLSPTAVPPSPAPTPRATKTTDPPTPTVTPSANPNAAPGRPPATSSRWLLVGISLGAATASLAAISMLVALRRNRSRLIGTLEIYQVKEEEHVR